MGAELVRGAPTPAHFSIFGNPGTGRSPFSINENSGVGIWKVFPFGGDECDSNEGILSNVAGLAFPGDALSSRSWELADLGDGELAS